MMDQIRDQYDSLYKLEDYSFGDGKPVPAVVRLSEYIDKGSVLDIGGGDGRNAIYLANLGFDVTVLDLSEVGLSKIKEVNKNINTKVSDVIQDEIESEYDVIVNTFVLHHMNIEDAKKVILKSKRHTKEKGINIIVTFSDSGGLYDRNFNTGRFYPGEKLMRELYSDWGILDLRIDEIETLAKDKKGNRMLNHVISIIATN